MQRPSTFADFPHLGDKDAPLFEPRANFIQITYVSTTIVGEISLDQITNLAENFLDHLAKAHCDWVIAYHLQVDANYYVMRHFT